TCADGAENSWARPCLTYCNEEDLLHLQEPTQERDVPLRAQGRCPEPRAGGPAGRVRQPTAVFRPDPHPGEETGPRGHPSGAGEPRQAGLPPADAAARGGIHPAPAGRAAAPQRPGLMRVFLCEHDQEHYAALLRGAVPELQLCTDPAQAASCPLWLAEQDLIVPLLRQGVRPEWLQST